MKRHIIHDSKPITLIGGAGFDLAALKQVLTVGTNVVAADGGARAALENGLMPAAVIGDFDSLDAATLNAIPAERLYKITEQKSTDFEKCLSRIEAPLILGVGFCAGRLDHQLAAFNALLRHPNKRCVLIGAEDLVFLAPPGLTLDLPVASRLSLFPMGPVTGRSEGLRWPISGIRFSPAGESGTSNEVCGPVRLEFDAARMLVLLPRTEFTGLVSALLQTAGKWPVP